MAIPSINFILMASERGRQAGRVRRTSYPIGRTAEDDPARAAHVDAVMARLRAGKRKANRERRLR